MVHLADQDAGQMVVEILTGHIHGQVVVGMPLPEAFAGERPLALPEHGAHGRAEALAERRRELVAERKQALHASFTGGVGELAGKTGGEGAVPRRVGEAVQPGEADFAAEGKRVLELLFGLTREAGDHVGRDGRARDGGIDPLRGLQKVAAGIASAHGFEDPLAAGLEGEVEVGHQPGVSPEPEQLGSDVLGLERAKAEARDVGAFEESGDQVMGLARRIEVTSPGAKLGAGDHDLARAGFNGSFDLGHHLDDRAGFLAAARLGDDAEGANVVAAFLSLHEGARVEPRSWGRLMGQRGRGGEPAEHELDEPGLAGVAGADDEVRAEGQGCVFAGGLREAARNGDGRVGRQAADGADQAAGLLVGDVGDGAGIDNEGVRLADVVNDVVASRAQAARDLLAVGKVELAAEGEDRGEGTSGHWAMVERAAARSRTGVGTALDGRRVIARPDPPRDSGGNNAQRRRPMDEDISRVIREAEEAATGGSNRVLDTLAGRLGAKASASAVFGEAVVRSGVTVIPVAAMRWGFGGGAGSGSKTGGGVDTGEGSGGGGGVIASPVGFIEVRDGSAVFHRVPPPVVPLIVAGTFSAWVLLRGVRRLLRG